MVCGVWCVVSGWWGVAGGGWRVVGGVWGVVVDGGTVEAPLHAPRNSHYDRINLTTC